MLAASVCGCLYGILMLVRNRPAAPKLRDPQIDLETVPDVDLAVGPDSSERRSTIRREGRPVPVLLSDLRAQAPPLAGFVVDRSTGGLRIAATEHYPIGAILTIRSTSAPAELPWVQVQVRSCDRVGDHYQMGCSFLEQPPWNVLLLFG